VWQTSMVLRHRAERPQKTTDRAVGAGLHVAEHGMRLVRRLELPSTAWKIRLRDRPSRLGRFGGFTPAAAPPLKLRSTG
jgi:hypothetical protein